MCLSQFLPAFSTTLLSVTYFPLRHLLTGTTKGANLISMKTKMAKALGAWVVAGTVSLAIVKLTSIGPVILTVSAERGWGVHTFDLITIIPATAAAVYSYKVLTADPA